MRGIVRILIEVELTEHANVLTGIAIPPARVLHIKEYV